jgi:hypothetical protein
MLKDMKRPKEKNTNHEVPMEMETAKYPYGLRITLNNQEISKLGLSVKELEVGQLINVTALARVNTLRDDKNERRENQSIELTLEQMDVTKPQSKTSKHFSKLEEGPE